MVMHDPDEQWLVLHSNAWHAVHEMVESKIKRLTKHEHTWLLWACTSSQQVGV